MELRTAEVYEFEDGKCIRATLGYPDMAEALEAVGLRKQGGERGYCRDDVAAER